MSIRLVQLIAPTEDHKPLLDRQGLAAIADYAAGIGPDMSLIVDPDSQPYQLKISNLVRNAHALGLQVHPYTFRRDASELPGYAADYDHLLDIFVQDIGVDGLFTDFPDLTVDHLRSKHIRSAD